MYKLPLDIWKLIFNLLDFESKIRLISACRYFRNILYITDLYNIEKKYLDKLTTKILKYYIFQNASLLKANNSKIKDTSFISSL